MSWTRYREPIDDESKSASKRRVPAEPESRPKRVSASDWDEEQRAKHHQGDDLGELTERVRTLNV